MYVGLDGIPLKQVKTGVGHYTSELARALADVAPDDKFELLMPPRPSLRSRYWSQIGLPLYINRLRLDLFHGTNYNIPLWKVCPTVLTIHDLSLLLWPQTHERSLVRRARRRLPMMARAATAIIVPSHAVKREVCDHLEIDSRKIVVIPEAAREAFQQIPTTETESVRRRLRVEDDFILFVGTIEPRKNLLTLVRAFEEILRSDSRRPQLVIAGATGWLSEDVFTYVRAAGISDRILFVGYLADDDLRALYSACRTFVYPSLYEGFGLPLLEAMACGAPVITSDTPSIRETVGEAARLVSPTDSRGLAQAMVRLLDDAAERQQRSVAGMRHARKFSWEKTARATLDLYREVLEKGTS